MAVTEKAGGTQTATLTTEHTLATVTDAGVYQLVVDVSALALSEILTLTLKTKVRTGATSREAWRTIIQHVQAVPNVYSIPVAVTTEIVAILRQDNGTGRAFPWSLYQLA